MSRAPKNSKHYLPNNTTRDHQDQRLGSCQIKVWADTPSLFYQVTSN